MDIENNLKGCIVGFLIGDALAYPYENIDKIKEYEIDMVRGLHEESVGSWSFPGAFALATMSSINDCDGINLDDIVEKFNDVYIAGYLTVDNECKDIGPVTSEAIKNYTNGLPPDKCGVENANFDCDCLLRILPVGLYLAFRPLDEIVDQAHQVCKITHSDYYSQVCCAVFCLIIRNILLQKSEKVFDILTNYYSGKDMKNHADVLSKFKEKPKDVLNTRNINDVFWGAWSTYVSYENSFEIALIESVYLGGDTNSRTSLVGALCGLSNGLNNIPNKWLNTIALTSESMEIIQKFVDRSMESQTSLNY